MLLWRYSADIFKVPNQLTLRRGDYPQWASQNQVSPKRNWILLGKHERIPCDRDTINGFEDGTGYVARNVAFRRLEGPQADSKQGNGNFLRHSKELKPAIITWIRKRTQSPTLILALGDPEQRTQPDFILTALSYFSLTKKLVIIFI